MREKKVNTATNVTPVQNAQDSLDRVAQVVGGSLQAEARDQLLELLAAYHRLIRLPARVALDAAPIRAAFPALLDLAELLLDRADPEAAGVADALDRCRAALR